MPAPLNQIGYGQNPYYGNPRLQMLAQHSGGNINIGSSPQGQQWLNSQPANPERPMSGPTNYQLPAYGSSSMPSAGKPMNAAPAKVSKERPLPGQAGYSSASAAQQQQQQSQQGAITTGIGVNPVVDPAALTALRNRMMQFAMPQGLSAGQQTQLGALQQQHGETASLDLDRQAALANQRQMLAAQQARANAGLGWAGIGAQDQLAGAHQALAMIQALGSFLDPRQGMSQLLAGFR